MEIGRRRAVGHRARLDDLARGDGGQGDATLDDLDRSERRAGGGIGQVGLDRAEDLGIEDLARVDVARGHHDGVGRIVRRLVVGQVDADGGEGDQRSTDDGSAAWQPSMSLDLHGGPPPSKAMRLHEDSVR